MQVPKDFLRKVGDKSGSYEPVADPVKPYRVRMVCFFACGLGAMHLVISILFLSLALTNQERIFRHDTHILQATTCWKGQHNLFSVFESIDITRKKVITMCIIIFHLLSGLFQLSPFILHRSFYPTDYAHRICTNGIMYLRYTEYSLSAPLVLIAMALVIGILDIFTLMFIGVLTMFCMILGLVADMLRWTTRTADIADKSRLCKLFWLLHWMGWVTVAVPWVVILTGFYSGKHNMLSTNSTICDAPTHLVNTTGTIPFNTTASIQKRPIPEMPAFVEPLIFVEGFLFAVFGFVQLWQFTVELGVTNMITRNLWIGDDKKKRDEFIGVVCESTYVFLSFCSKMILGVVTFSSVLFTNDDT